MLNTEESKEKKQCSYRHENYICPFNAEESEEFCIFHLSVEKKDPKIFWKHLANYIIVLIEKEIYINPPTKFLKTDANPKIVDFVRKNTSWIFQEQDASLVNEYRSKHIYTMAWVFFGFRFPKMDNKNNFVEFVFAGTYFRYAQFSGKANFESAQFSDEADFMDAKFSGEVDFGPAKFSGKANFAFTQFSGAANFVDAKFSGEADFVYAQFSGAANFWSAKFSGAAIFMSQFSSAAMFESAQFSGAANFWSVQFSSAATFEHAKFSDAADFSDSKVKILNFSRCEISSFLRLRTIKHFSQNGVPVILLRDLRFWENGYLLLEDFDVSKVSFWHTNFHIIRQRIDFVRVNWGQEKIIIDDIYSKQEYKKYKEWKEIPKEELENRLTKEEKDNKKELDLIYNPIEQTENRNEEIERCYRQIRMSYEAGGEHPDAGDFYKHEMRVRGKRLKKDKKFIWCLHKLYGLVSSYGESPAKSLIWLCGIVVTFSIIYIFTGVEDINGIHIQYYLRGDKPNISSLILDFGKSIVYALSNLIPSIGRLNSFKPFTWWTILFSFLEGILGVSVITLFVLAVRRRFRRESQ